MNGDDLILTSKNFFARTYRGSRRESAVAQLFTLGHLPPFTDEVPRNPDDSGDECDVEYDYAEIHQRDECDSRFQIHFVICFSFLVCLQIVASSLISRRRQPRLDASVLRVGFLSVSYF